MLIEYINKALEQAHYEIIDDDEPYYGEIPKLPGVWATESLLKSAAAILPALTKIGFSSVWRRGCQSLLLMVWKFACLNCWPPDVEALGACLQR